MHHLRIAAITTLGFLAVAGCQDGDATAQKPEAASSGLEQLCIDTINEYRTPLGLTPYTRWDSAESCSSDQAMADAQGTDSHGAFGKCGELAQNECPGWSGPAEPTIKKCLATMWAEGPGGGHYENMRSTKYTKVACGFYTTSAGKFWSIQNFK